VSLWANTCPADNPKVRELRKQKWPRDAGNVPQVTKVIYINMDWDPARRQYMEDQLDELSHSWPEYGGHELRWARLPGVDANELQTGVAYETWRGKGFSKAPVPKVDGDWKIASCAFNHYSAIKHLPDTDESGLVLIVEDDVEIKPDFPKLWEDLWPWLPEEWDVIRVGWFGDHQNCSQVVNSYVDLAAWQQPKDGICSYCGLQAYIVNPSSRDRVLQRFERSRMTHADEIVSAPTPLMEDPEDVPPLNVFVAWPQLAATHYSESGYPAFLSDRRMGQAAVKKVKATTAAPTTSSSKEFVPQSASSGGDDDDITKVLPDWALEAAKQEAERQKVREQRIKAEATQEATLAARKRYEDERQQLAQHYRDEEMQLQTQLLEKAKEHEIKDMKELHQKDLKQMEAMYRKDNKTLQIESEKLRQEAQSRAEAQQAADKAREEAQKAVKHAEQKAREEAQRREEAEQAAQKAREEAEQAAQKAHEEAHKAHEEAEQAAQRARQEAHKAREEAEQAAREAQQLQVKATEHFEKTLQEAEDEAKRNASSAEKLEVARMTKELEAEAKKTESAALAEAKRAELAAAAEAKKTELAEIKRVHEEEVARDQAEKESADLRLEASKATNNAKRAKLDNEELEKAKEAIEKAKEEAEQKLAETQDALSKAEHEAKAAELEAAKFQEALKAEKVKESKYYMTPKLPGLEDAPELPAVATISPSLAILAPMPILTTLPVVTLTFPTSTAPPSMLNNLLGL